MRSDAYSVMIEAPVESVRRPVEVTTDEVSAVVDFHLRPAPGVRVTAYSRVMPAGAGSVYTFTQVQAHGMPDDTFDGRVRALRHELAALKAALEQTAVEA